MIGYAGVTAGVGHFAGGARVISFKCLSFMVKPINLFLLFLQMPAEHAAMSAGNSQQFLLHPLDVSVFIMFRYRQLFLNLLLFLLPTDFELLLELL
jgi:hypothetical protein